MFLSIKVSFNCFNWPDSSKKHKIIVTYEGKVQIYDPIKRTTPIQQVSLTAWLHLTHKGQEISTATVGPADVLCNNTTVISCQEPTSCLEVPKVLLTFRVELQTLVLIRRRFCVKVSVVEHSPILPSPLLLQADKQMSPPVTLRRSEGGSKSQDQRQTFMW